MMQTSTMMDADLSMLSSLREEFKPEDYVQPHYRESYRLAIDALISEGKDGYQKFIKDEKVGNFLSEEEILFITTNVEKPQVSSHSEEVNGSTDDKSSTGTYWPMHSDIETPDLDLGWPEIILNRAPTNVDLLFHPPRQNSPTIKEVIRKHIQEARQVIAIAMDVFTDLDVFKEVVDASIRGVPVYILLDRSHFKSFLAMAENQDVQIQKLRNMRVRTVKGQDYLSRSGAKFHGAMEQKFLLVDCCTVFFGSYSFMWSYEKIHLSMVQVITGKLVESYDEEFRTIYARSTVPAELSPLETVADKWLNGKIDRYAPLCGKPFERRDHLRHTLNLVYQQTCERQSGFKIPRGEPDDRFHEYGQMNQIPVINHNRIHQMHVSEATDFYKRHSYAGERPEPSYVYQPSKFASSHWNVAGDASHYGALGSNHFHGTVENQYETGRMGPLFRGSNMRGSYHGCDKQALAMQQNLPSFANTSKSFLRTWRIESYLNNNDPVAADSVDHLDQYEILENKPGPHMHSRLRSSLVFKSTIPEHPESNSYTTNSSSSTLREEPTGMQSNAQFYHSAQWNQPQYVNNHIQHDEFVLKRRSLQILDYSGQNMDHSSGRDAFYASLGRAKGRLLVKDHESMQEKYKRHSVADPKSNIYYDENKQSSQMYGSSVRQEMNKSAIKEVSRSGGYVSNLKKDQRSISHYDFNKTDTKGTTGTMWQEPPSRTVSATNVPDHKEESAKSNGMSSPRFFKSSSKKIKSLLNIPDKREASPKMKNRLKLTVGNNYDNILTDDEEQKGKVEKKQRGSTSGSVKSIDSSKQRRDNGRSQDLSADLPGEASAPRFSTDELHRGSGDTTKSQRQPSTGAQKESHKPVQSSWQRDRSGLNRPYSRFEPLCQFENKHLSSGQSSAVPTNSQSIERHKNFSKAASRSETHGHIGQQSQGAHDNKFGRFIQRVGNLIHKNK
ncbi:protein FAM83B [Chanos chanos]|uniref:Protein FAM83B n=1 Tax=Chanos chanos TaxID=29144 RepID=A0A6J2VAF1_CHACN|nr:protein FAM83B [Chanos chanos]